MSKFSVVMLVSRSNNKFRRAVESVALQEPDEFRAYIDTVAVDYLNQPYVESVLKDANAKVLTQHPTLSFDRHENMVRNLHRAFMEAEGEWISQCADDDEMLGPIRKELIQIYGSGDVGIIHGDKIVSYPLSEYLKRLWLLRFAKSLFKPRLVQGAKPMHHRDIRGKIHDGTTIIKRDAFVQVHPILDHGYFCDWKLFYWVLRTGWKSIYVPKVLYLHNIHADVNPVRQKYWGKWPEIVEELDAIKI